MDEAGLETRVALVEQAQTTHEQICAARWGILIKLVGWGGALAFTVTLGLAGWGLNRLYDGQQQQNAMLQQIIAHR